MIDVTKYDLMSLVEIAGYPEDIYDAPEIFETDIDDSWKAADLTEMDEFDLDEWRENACCPDSIWAAHSWCGCGGSGQLPSWVRRNWEVNAA